MIAANPTAQLTTVGAALTYSGTPLASGTAMNHINGTADVVITTPGIYQASFHTAAVAGASVPATLSAQLTVNGIAIGGAVSSHRFTAADEGANLSFDAPFLASANPTTVRVTVDQSGITLANTALTVIRLGPDAP